MPTAFTLELSTTGPAAAEFRLLDADGIQLGYQAVDFAHQPASLMQGVFNLREFVSHYAGKVEDIGVFLAKEVLGGLFPPLANSKVERTLTLRLPDPENNPLAAALARVPWEIAQAAPDQPTLAETNLQIRAIAKSQAQAQGLPLNPGEPVRVLLVFAEAPGSTPLAMRQERQELLELFTREIFPKRKVELDILAHGVTRERLRRQVEARGGYHLLHWSGHGAIDCLESYGEDGRSDRLSGAELAELFTQAGGYIPALVFLSACHSGDLGAIANWDDFRARVTGTNPAQTDSVLKTESVRPLAEQLAAQPGYTGTAHRLLQASTPAVVAMRYAIGDDYARNLAREFYRHLFADEQSKPAAAALNLARNALRRDSDEDSGYSACDHATPILHGENVILKPAKGKTQRGELRPALKVGELRIRVHPYFVGRIQPLAALGGWFGEGGDACPVALIQGLGGMGKTALAAEAIDVWHGQFDWVFAYQAKPEALSLEEVLRDFHTRLNEQQGVYAERIKDFPAEAVWQSAKEGFRGTERYAKLRDNLLQALREERILLVLDNFEQNLKLKTDSVSKTESVSPDVYACQDPEWDALLAALPEALADWGSRVLITCRHKPAALHAMTSTPSPNGGGLGWVRDKSEASLLPDSPPPNLNAVEVSEPVPSPNGGGLGWGRDKSVASLLSDRPPPNLPPLGGGVNSTTLPLGEETRSTASKPAWGRPKDQDHLLHIRLETLPNGEAVLFARRHPALRKLLFGDARQQFLSRRILNVSRGHPLLLDRLAKLAELPQPETLQDALKQLESRADFSKLPDLFSVGAKLPQQEREYLLDALQTSLDGLLELAGPEARHLLWVLSLADDPVPEEILRGVWSGMSIQQEQINQVRGLLKLLEQKPEEFRRQLYDQMPDEIRAMLDQPAAAEPAADMKPHLQTLLDLGLATVEDEVYTCHELTRERIAVWMQTHPDERKNRDEKQVWIAYSERWVLWFNSLFHENQDAALEMGRRALVGFVRAGAFDQLGNFASQLVISTSDPRVLNALRPHLETAVAQAPEGKARWCCRCYLADALLQAGQMEASLGFYAEAEAEARSNENWADVAWITGNWANALRDTGKMDAARDKLLADAEASRRAGRPEIHELIRELEALRIDIMQGLAAEVLEPVEAGLAKIEDWHKRAEAGETVPETPNRESRLRALVSALDIAEEAHFALEQWPEALAKIERMIGVERFAGRGEMEIATTRYKRAVVLKDLKDYGKAQAELESLLDLFETAGDHYRKAAALSTLANLFYALNDVKQAATQERRASELFNTFEDIANRAISHNNLAGYLEKIGATVESADHQLAALAYQLAAGLGQDLKDSLHNYAYLYQEAKAAGTELVVPRLAELLDKPEFTALTHWLQQNGMAPADLQAAIDQALSQARNA